MEGQVSSTDPRASFQSRLSAGAPEPTFHLPAAVDPGGDAAPEDPQTSSADLSCREDDEGWAEARRRRLDSLHYGGGVSARWEGASRDAPEGGGGIRRADLIAPMLYEGVEDEGGEEEEEEVSVALSAYLVTWPEGAQACHLLAWAHCLSIYCDGSVHPEVQEVDGEVAGVGSLQVNTWQVAARRGRPREAMAPGSVRPEGRSPVCLARQTAPLRDASSQTSLYV